MAQQADYVKDLSQIRSLMERSSRFISLSGLSGVFAGLFALAGAAVVHYQLHYGRFVQYKVYPARSLAKFDPEFVKFCMLVAGIVLIGAIGSGIYFTTRKARKAGQKIFDRTAMRLVLNMAIPLLAGGIFCIALLYQAEPGLIAPAMLIFYGLALINGSKYTLDDIRYLGLCEIGLGLVAAFFIGYGLFFWAVGFGLLHIVYGTAMYFKYDRI
ncbi:MAG TPA: hypothetical protein VK927_02240 [Adhaeribacter sp.]|nr:hypothetical protein [Adhaeribacter sp.]